MSRSLHPISVRQRSRKSGSVILAAAKSGVLYGRMCRSPVSSRELNDLSLARSKGMAISGTLTPDVELTQELVGARLDAMAELPRTVFLLRHLDGLEVAAIGARLGIAAEDVERELAHALRVLAWRSTEAEAGVMPVDRAELCAVADAEGVELRCQFTKKCMK